MKRVQQYMNFLSITDDIQEIIDVFTPYISGAFSPSEDSPYSIMVFDDKSGVFTDDTRRALISFEDPEAFATGLLAYAIEHRNPKIVELFTAMRKHVEEKGLA
jgi:hypothetical protein